MVTPADAQRLREDSKKLREQRYDEVQIVADSKAPLKPKVKTEAKAEVASFALPFHPSLSSSTIKKPSAASKVTGVKKALTDPTSTLNQSMEGLKPAPGEWVGWATF